MLNWCYALLLVAEAVNVQRLMDTMSLQAKIGQMSQIDIEILVDQNNPAVLNQSALDLYITKYQIGSVFNSPFSGGDIGKKSAWSPLEFRSVIEQIQKAAAASETGIPVIFGIDSVHGANYIQNATLFGQQINLAATFNEDLARKVGEITAKDTRASGIPWVFAPILGVMMQPSWPRVYETFGEDPHLIGKMGAAIIIGMQGGFPRNLNSPRAVASTMKHFLGYPFPQNGHDRVPSWIPDRMLYQYFIPPFQAAVDAGVATTMESYNEVNGIPLASSHEYLQTLLREEMNFKGVLVTDYNEINNLHEWHYIADTEEKAVQIAISQTSIDMSMIPLDHDFCDELLRLVNQGKIQKTRIDESVERVLNLKEELGIFENPVVNDPNDYLLQTIGSTEDKEIAYEVAIESVILAKNKDDMLPLSVKSSKKIFLTGPGADSLAVLSGGWTYHWQGVKDDQDFSYGLTIKSSIEFMLKSRNSSVSLSYHPGCNFEDFCPESVLNEALKLAAEADLVIYVTGEKPYAEKPGNIDDLNIDPTQSEYGKHLISKNINMVLVLLSGRPRTLGYLSDFASAILVGFLPGPSGAFAITDLIFGIRNPSGKFPISYPKLPNVSPSPYWHKNSQDDTYNVLWPFGFGLSYTSFAYSNLELSRNVISPADELRVSVFVWNTGKRAGKETVLMYIKDYYRIVTPEVKMLKGFKKVTLEAEESRKIEFTITAADLAFYGVDPKKKQLEDGKFSVMIGDQSLDFELTNSSSWQMI